MRWEACMADNRRRLCWNVAHRLSSWLCLCLSLVLLLSFLFLVVCAGSSSFSLLSFFLLAWFFASLVATSGIYAHCNFAEISWLRMELLDQLVSSLSLSHGQWEYP
eukprot:TRINITY_DN10990_c0_g1_i1.p1 TRINITY_DN10990_c0_g1~~TRINITY_DN10990_c0_g1_i1.p1  ORF type:complete len:106 (-),score=5.89 TRINITY_DN10990_c0_g1_i1:153-470(-)